MNPQNGLCLCAIHDRAFDSGLLIITCDYKIDFHADIVSAAKVDSAKTIFLQFAGKSIHLPDRWPPDPVLLERQRELMLARGERVSATN
jgi:putative restriction endonuclease